MLHASMIWPFSNAPVCRKYFQVGELRMNLVWGSYLEHDAEGWAQWEWDFSKDESTEEEAHKSSHSNLHNIAYLEFS